MGLKILTGRQNRAGLTIALAVLLAVSSFATGTGEPEPQMNVDGGGPLREGATVVATGTVSVVGNEPFTALVLRTTATEQILMEITGPAAERIRDHHQGRTVTVDGTVLRVPEGAQPGLIRVDELRRIYR